MKRYLLVNESKWVKDIADEDKWKKEFQIVKAGSMAEANAYFKSVAPNVQELVPDKQIHFAHITEENGTYETKWMFPHEEPVLGFPKGGCAAAETTYECALREFKEETLWKLQETPIDSLTFNIGKATYEFFVVEVNCDVMENIVERFNENKANNNGDGAEPNELLLFTRSQLINPARQRQTNMSTRRAMELLFSLRRGGRRTRRRARRYGRKTPKN